MTRTDTNDLVARLRSYARDQGGWHNIDETCEAAADIVERLLRERDEARLRGDVHQGPMQGFAAIDPATANVDWRARATNLAADVDRLTRERDQERHARQLHSAEIARLTIERDEARGGREARHRAWLEAKARIAELTRERDEAQRENMDMVWQRRSAEFRAKAAEARITKLEAALDSLLRDQHGRL